MKKVLIVYYSRTGHTEKMAEFIAEGVRMEGCEAELLKISEVKDENMLQGYDAYIFGCPTYHRDMTNGMKTFLFLAQKAALEGKIGGTFGSYTHSGDAPKLIADTMEHVFKMKIVDLGSLNLKEHLVSMRDGMKACHDYGKTVCKSLTK